ncbi:MAG: hypothetical protein Q4C45_01325 [Oscillospiraceae bacterium]|nr:hypothetical protein [Oscillospiraceae bacterium]
MKIWSQKFLSLLIALYMVMTALPAYALADGPGSGAALLFADTAGVYEVYYELYDAGGVNRLTADRDQDGAFDVEAGGSYVARVFIRLDEDRTIRAFHLELTYDAARMSVLDDTSFTDVQHDTAAVDAGTILYELHAPDNAALGYAVTANTGLQVAQFTFTVREDASGAAMTLGFGSKNEVAVQGEINAVPAAVTPASVDIPPPVLAILSAAASGNTGTVTAALPELGKPADLVTAFYNAAGRMAGVDMRSVDSAAGKVTVSAALSEPPASVRVFLLDPGSRAPLALCAAYSFSR